MKYHIGIAGSGIAGAVLARELAETGKFKIAIYEERDHVGGLAHTYRDDETGIMVHKYGPQIFHTNNEEIWNYFNYWGRFESVSSNTFTHAEKGVFALPINLLTINQFFEKQFTPKEAQDFIGSLSEYTKQKNLEASLLKTFGRDLYENFMRPYLKKFWQRDPSEILEASDSVPLLKFNYNCNYYDKIYQGIPVSGYTEIIRRLLDHADIELRLNQKLDADRKRDFDHLFWSGPMDGFYQSCYGSLEFNSFEYERIIDQGDLQGCSTIEYTEEKYPITRSIEFKHLTPWEQHTKTLLFKEYPKAYSANSIPYYPVHTADSLGVFDRYQQLAQQDKNLTFIGQAGTYRNLQMEQVIAESRQLAKFCTRHDLKDWPRFSHIM